MDCRGDPWIMVIFGWLRQNPPFYYYSESFSTRKFRDEAIERNAKSWFLLVLEIELIIGLSHAACMTLRVMISGRRLDSEECD